MAFDISTGAVSAEPRPDLSDAAPGQFDEFHEVHGDSLMRLLLLACNDEDLADQACRAALMRAQRRWKQIGDHPDPLAWAFGVGLNEAHKTLRDRPADTINEATGGYMRGLALPEALAALPLHQRAALVSAYCAGWADEDTALGFGVERSTIATRRTRGVTFLAHHLRADTIETEAQLVALLAQQHAAMEPTVPTLNDVRRGARRRAWRDRALIAAAVLGIIALGGALVQAAPDGAPDVEIPETALPPNSTGDWFGPVSDGRGGFVALNVRGASRFVASSDGGEWFDEAVWNSRAADLRTEVTSFDRSGRRYVATIEAAGAITGFVPPRVALSTNLSTWNVRAIEIEEPVAVDGLRRRFRIVRTAWAGEKLLVAVEIDESLDHRALAIAPPDVCVESATAASRVAHLCDGRVIEVSREQLPNRPRTRFFLAEDGGDFVEVSLPINPRSIVAAGNGFSAVLADGAISVSSDGLQWTAVGSAQQEARFLLIEGNSSGQTLQVSPAAEGWTTTIYDAGSQGVTGSLPLAIDPASIWSKPDLAAGPAGWALFVTSSRPWDRGEVVPGWAIETPKWIVSQLPDADVIWMQRIDGAVTYTFSERAGEVVESPDGSMLIFDPVTGDLLAEISSEAVEASRTTSLRADGIKSEVLFSADGSTWRSIWQSRDDAWFGSVAVGDDEVVLSGVHLAGRPISIPIDN